jgi:multidrug resistance efflux pump
MKRRIPIIIILLTVVAGAVWWACLRRANAIVLTGIVTTDSVIVSSEISGRLQQLLVKQGDEVTNGQLLAVIQPREWKADAAYYAGAESQSSALVTEAAADLKFQEAQTTNEIRQAEATLAATKAQVTQAEADLENADLVNKREEGLFQRGVDSRQTYDQSRTTYAATRARVDSLNKQVLAAEAALALAKANSEQTAARRAALQASAALLDAAKAQTEKADARLSHTEIRAPIAGIIDTRAALQGEVVNPAQAIVTLINPDDLWVRADVEETYITRIHLDDRLAVRLPSGAVREGVVFYRGIDADYATQRDVSRTKRDIKTFQIRLRCDNRDRSLAVGMSAYVTLPLATH